MAIVLYVNSGPDALFPHSNRHRSRDAFNSGGWIHSVTVCLSSIVTPGLVVDAPPSSYAVNKHPDNSTASK